jgi:hypothetical protein
MSSLFSQVAEVFTRRQQKKIEDREALVNAILGKQPPTAAQIATTLDEIGWAPDGLEKEVARRLQRRQYAATLAALPQLRAEKAELERAAEQENVRYEAALRPLEADHQRTIDSLNGRYREVVVQIPVAESMTGKLLETYRGPLQPELSEIRDKQMEIMASVALIVRTAVFNEEAASSSDVADDRASRQKIAKGCRAAEAEKKAELPALEARAAEIERLMLQPE